MEYFKAFFPYLDDISLQVDKILEFSLREAYRDQSSLDFLITLKRISSLYNDGHMFVRSYGDQDTLNSRTCPIVFDMVNGKIVVKEVLDSSLASKMAPGDILDSINHKNSIDYLANQKGLISGSEQWKNYIGLQNLCNGPKGSYCALTIKRNGNASTFVVARNNDAIEYRSGNFSSHPVETGWIKPGVLYLNLTRDPTARLMKFLKNSDSAKSVILDLRGYPVDQEVFDLPKLFIKHKSTLNNRMFTPMILNPDFKKIKFIAEGRQVFEPSEKFRTAKVFLLVDASAQSAAETLAGTFKDLKIALLVGQPTSGANGNINNIWLPGRYYVGYSGMKVLNSDGNKQHLIGIVPDVVIEKTLKGLQEKRDEILEAAIRMTGSEN